MFRIAANLWLHLFGVAVPILIQIFSTARSSRYTNSSCCWQRQIFLISGYGPYGQTNYRRIYRRNFPNCHSKFMTGVFPVIFFIVTLWKCSKIIDTYRISSLQSRLFYGCFHSGPEIRYNSIEEKDTIEKSGPLLF